MDLINTDREEGIPMKPKERREFFISNRTKVTRSQMMDILRVRESTVKRYEREFGPCLPETEREVEPRELIAAERRVRELSDSTREEKRKLRYLEDEVEKLERALQLSAELSNYSHTVVIKPPKKSTTRSESVMVALLSDVHAEKRIKKELTSGVNEYDLDIAKARVSRYFINVVKMLEKEQADTDVNNLILGFLGDFVDGDIHEELLETSLLEPMHAVLFAYDMLSAGIQYILDNTKVKIIIQCKSGNHARTTMKTRASTEAGHSTETLLYNHLRIHFRNEERVQLIIEPGIHSYIEVFGYTIRFMHGHHGVKYNNGIGGISVGLNRIIPRWNTVRHAHLSVMGHWHSLQDTGNAIVNGSVIGYDPYALSIGAPMGYPEQVYFFVNSKYGRTGHNKIFLS